MRHQQSNGGSNRYWHAADVERDESDNKPKDQQSEAYGYYSFTGETIHLKRSG
jgi:hypothetical protein